MPNLYITYKAMHGLAPQYLSDLIKPYSPLGSLRSASKLLLNSPSFNLKTYGYKSFSAPPRLWNSLPFYITSSSSAEIFKKRLKTYLFAPFSINFCHSSDLNERHLIFWFLICLQQLQNTVRWKIEQ